MTRTKHHSHQIKFPAYALTFVSPNQIVVGGGGGASSSGVHNEMAVFSIKGPKLTQLNSVKFEKGEDAPYGLACDSSVLHCAVNSTGEKVIAGQNQNLRAFDLSTLKQVRSAQTSPSTSTEQYTRTLAISPDGSFIAAGGSDGFVHLLRANTYQTVWKPYNVGAEVYTLHFDSDSNRLLVATPDTISVLSTTATKRQVAKCLFAAKSERSQKFRAARFCEPYVFALSNTTPIPGPKRKMIPGKAILSRRPIDELSRILNSREVSQRPATAMDISHDGGLIAFADSGLTVGIVRTRDMAPVLSILQAHTFASTDLKFSPAPASLSPTSPKQHAPIVSVPESTTLMAEADPHHLLVSVSADRSIRVIEVPARLSQSNPILFALLMAIVALVVALLVAMMSRK